MHRQLWLLAMLLLSGAAGAQPSSGELADHAAHRFPQPVRVGDLVGRDVIAPMVSQPDLGRVAGIVRQPGGDVVVLVRFGGVAGIGSRLIAVPVEAVALLGEHVVVVDYTSDQLRGFPTVADAPAALPGDTVIKVGLVAPFH